jgi:hypothetical protein
MQKEYLAYPPGINSTPLNNIAVAPATQASAQLRRPSDGRADMPQGRFGVCSRNNHLPDKPGCLFWQAALSYDLRELCGSSICKNREGFPRGEHDFYVYGIFDIEAQAALSPSETEDLAGKLVL